MDDNLPSSPLLTPTDKQLSTRSRPSYLIPIGITLVLLQLVCQQTQNEMFFYQMANTTFRVPVEGIYMNHTWLVWMWVGAWVVCCYQRTGTWLTSPLNPFRRFWQHATSKWTWQELLVRVVVLEWLMFIPNVAWTMSLKNKISVTLSIATQQSQCVFVYLFTLVWFRRRSQRQSSWFQTFFSPSPFAVFSCLLGVVLVCSGESATGAAGNGDASNYLLLSVNPIFIALFDLVFSRWSAVVCRDTEDVLMLMSMMGIACFVTCWPAMFLEDDVFQLPSPFSENGSLLYGNSALATVYNFGFMVGLSLMGPLFISVGAVLQLPLSALTDLVIYHRTINFVTGIGGLFICSGFVVLTCYAEQHDDDGGQMNGRTQEEDDHEDRKREQRVGNAITIGGNFTTLEEI